MTIERALVEIIREWIADRPEVLEVCSVGTTYDLVAIMRLPRNYVLAKLVTEHLTQFVGIIVTDILARSGWKRHSPIALGAAIADRPETMVRL